MLGFGRDMDKADIDIVKEVKTGQRSAFSELVKRHQKGLYNLALRFTRDPGAAEDIVQDTLVKAYQKLHTFEERSSFKSWLFRIAINNSKNRLRSLKGELDIEDVTVRIESQAQANVEKKELRAILDHEVHRLPQKQRTALILRVYEDLSFQEIADIMDCPYDTAKANYRHAVLKLKDLLAATKLKSFKGTSSWGTPVQSVSNVPEKPKGDA